MEDTCRVPCSEPWPCSAACTPAGFQLAGHPRSGPGRSVSVHEGSGLGLTTCFVRKLGGRLLCPLLLLLLRSITGLPLLEPVAPVPGSNTFLIGSGAQRAWSIWRLQRTAKAFWWMPVLCCRGVVPRQTPPGWRCVPHLRAKNLRTRHQVTCKKKHRWSHNGNQAGESAETGGGLSLPSRWLTSCWLGRH